MLLEHLQSKLDALQAQDLTRFTRIAETGTLALARDIARTGFARQSETAEV